MRVTPFLILTAVCLLVVLGERPEQKNRPPRRPSQDIQREEEVFTGEHPYGQFRIIYHARGPEDEPIADIIWLRKAAQLTISKGSSYFNVVNQDVTDDKNLTIEGVIELVEDPMTAEYDAHEILSLVISQESL